MNSTLAGTRASTAHLKRNNKNVVNITTCSSYFCFGGSLVKGFQTLEPVPGLASRF